MATVPYLLFLAQRSDSFRDTVADDVYDTVNLDMADRGGRFNFVRLFQWSFSLYCGIPRFS